MRGTFFPKMAKFMAADRDTSALPLLLLTWAPPTLLHGPSNVFEWTHAAYALHVVHDSEGSAHGRADRVDAVDTHRPRVQIGGRSSLVGRATCDVAPGANATGCTKTFRFCPLASEHGDGSKAATAAAATVEVVTTVQERSATEAGVGVGHGVWDAAVALTLWVLRDYGF